MINVEAHATHCRMARIIIIIKYNKTLAVYYRCIINCKKSTSFSHRQNKDAISLTSDFGFCTRGPIVVLYRGALFFSLTTAKQRRRWDSSLSCVCVVEFPARNKKINTCPGPCVRIPSMPPLRSRDSRHTCLPRLLSGLGTHRAFRGGSGYEYNHFI